ncbi:MAG: hypothetical protein AB9866_21730 [Syntrophobacteraceae bacterium]
MGRKEGAKNKTAREHLQDAEIAKQKAKNAALKDKLKGEKKK